MGDLKSKQNEVINALQLDLKLLKSNFQKIFQIGGKIFDYFLLYNRDAQLSQDKGPKKEKG